MQFKLITFMELYFIFWIPFHLQILNRISENIIFSFNSYWFLQYNFFLVLNLTSLHLAVENEDVDSVKYLLSRKDLNVNESAILKKIFLLI